MNAKVNLGFLLQFKFLAQKTVNANRGKYQGIKVANRSTMRDIVNITVRKV